MGVGEADPTARSAKRWVRTAASDEARAAFAFRFDTRLQRLRKFRISSSRRLQAGSVSRTR